MNDQKDDGHTQLPPVRVDLHCHSSASDEAAPRGRRTIALPECATAPREVYELAKRRGMDFVTITDHNKIAGVLELADQPDVFISEELTAWFKDEPQAVHVLCFGVTPDDHGRLQRLTGDVVACAEYLQEHEIPCALAHPFFPVAAPLTPSHRRALAELFGVWETRNGASAPELNAPAAIYIETHGAVGIGGSDDHGGVDIGRTYTEAPYAATAAELLAHIRAGRVAPGGEFGSTAKWAHSALALAARSLATLSLADGGGGEQLAAIPDPAAALKLIERIMLEDHPRRGNLAAGLGPDDGRRLLRAWLREMELESDTSGLVAMLQDRDFRHSDLARRARRMHERKLAAAVNQLARDAKDGERAGKRERAGNRENAGNRESETAAARLFAACVPALPYVPAAALHSRGSRLATAPDELRRVAVIADGVGPAHGDTPALTRLREQGIPGHEIDVIGTGANVDRRLPAVSEIELPFYPGVALGVPSLFAVAEALTDRRYDLVHLCASGPAGIAAQLIARVMDLPVAGSFDTDLRSCARIHSSDPRVEQMVVTVLAAFYRHCDLVLSPSRSADRSLLDLGIESTRVHRWERGVDLEQFSPAHYTPDVLPNERFNVLYTGRLSREKGLSLLSEAFLIARDRDPRLHLVLAGNGPDQEWLQARLGGASTFLGWLEGEALAQAYASADLFVFPSTTDTFGQVILEAQASGVPVLAVDAGGGAELIETGRNGCLVPPEPEALAGAVRGLARRAALRDRLATGGLLAVRDRSWQRSLTQLAAGWALALGRRSAPTTTTTATTPATATTATTATTPATATTATTATTPATATTATTEVARAA